MRAKLCLSIKTEGSVDGLGVEMRHQISSSTWRRDAAGSIDDVWNSWRKSFGQKNSGESRITHVEAQC